MRRKLVVVSATLLWVTGIATAAVVRSTAKTPTNFSSGVSASSIGVAFGFQGPGAIAGTTAGAVSVVSGSLSKSAEGSTTLNFDSDSGGNHYRLLTTVVVGISFAFAKKFSFLWWSNGSMTSTNSLAYTVTKDDDGEVQVVLSDAVTTVAQTGGNGFQFKPLFKYYGQLVNFSNHASLQTSVKSSSTITASPLSFGVANGQIAGFVFGVP